MPEAPAVGIAKEVREVRSEVYTSLLTHVNSPLPSYTLVEISRVHDVVTVEHAFPVSLGIRSGPYRQPLRRRLELG